MADFENDYLLFRNELILKYGEKPLKSAANKAGAMLLLSGSFKHVPNNASVEEEIAILHNIIDNMSKPPIKDDFSPVQESFRNNRLSEIVKENKDSSYFNSPTNKTIEDKITAAEAMGLLFPSIKDKKISTGHTIGELVSDLYVLYVNEYKLYRQNPQHPIFLSAILDGCDFPKTPQQPIKETTGAGETKGGCLGVMLFIIALVSFLYLV